MGTAPGSLKLVKAGFVVLDGLTALITRVIVLQYNPETLVRRIDAVPVLSGVAGGMASTGAAAAGVKGGGAPVALPQPTESVSFTISLDATDKLERGDAVTQQNGLFPVISALELLLYPANAPLIVWVSGGKRILPVRLTSMVVNEQAFDPALNPIRAEVSVQLQVLKDADLAAGSKCRALWDAHYNQLQQLANALQGGTLNALGVTGI